MTVLFDHNVNRLLKRHLPGHQIKTTREKGWDKLANGELLRAAAKDGFETILSIDKNIQYQQNLSALPLAVVIPDSVSNALPALIPFVPHTQKLLTHPLEKALYIIAPDGHLNRIIPPAKE